MKVAAKLTDISMSAQKLRLIADQIRLMKAGRALDILTFSPKKGAAIARKVLLSAMANAEHNENANIDDLSIAEIYVDEGTTLKRFRARAKGRANQILKRRCHLTIKVSDGEND